MPSAFAGSHVACAQLACDAMDNLTQCHVGAVLALFWAAFWPVGVHAAPQETASTAAPSLPAAASYLLVQLTGKAKMIGYPAVCPGSSPDEDQSEIICLAELYEAPAHVLQHLGGAPTERRLTIRFTAHSFHAVWQKDVRFLLGVVPFEDKGATGHFAYFWDWEGDTGEFCRGANELDDLEAPIRDFYRSGRVRKASARDDDWERGWEIACVKGRPGRER